MASYIPVRTDDHARVEAVMEVYSDVTDLVAQMQTTQWQIVGVVLGTLALLYFFLYAIARRADRIIGTQREQMRVAHAAMLRHQASHDSLTALPNRASLSERIDLMLKVARRAGTRVAVLSIDVHGLRGVNQSPGHATGDRVLKEVGWRRPPRTYGIYRAKVRNRLQHARAK